MTALHTQVGRTKAVLRLFDFNKLSTQNGWTLSRKKVERIFAELDKLNGLELHERQMKKIAPVLVAIMQSGHGILDVIGRSKI